MGLLQNRIRGDGDDDYGFRVGASLLGELRTLIFVSDAKKDGKAGRLYQRTRNVNHQDHEDKQANKCQPYV
jgi:hypothetical protein